jgi:steroid delta-isomerase-like uncharacterized protein
MDSNQKLIEDFYNKIWNSGDETTAHRILAPNFRFRGSTGPTKSGVEEFLDYVRLIRDALSEYDCVIETIVTENQQSFAKMLFRGRHTGQFFGVAPSGRVIEWAGAALFHFERGQIDALWVLGDVDHLKSQLGLSKQIAP